MECHPGLEIRPGDDIDRLTLDIKLIALAAMANQKNDHERIVMEVEAAIKSRWPDRAYFIETEEDGKGVQVYDPRDFVKARCECTT